MNHNKFYLKFGCQCGNCSLDSLQNAKECWCCTETEGCMLAISCSEVQEDVERRQLDCVTQHPGFAPVCLNEWCLRLSAGNYKKKDGKRYSKTGFEDEYCSHIIHADVVVNHAIKRNNKKLSFCVMQKNKKIKCLASTVSPSLLYVYTRN